MEEEKQLSEKESLQLTNRMIHEAKGYYYESGISALVYGFSIFVCSLLTYGVEKNLIIFPFHPFYILVPVFFIQGWIQYKEEKKKKAKTFTDEAIDFVWIGFFISAITAFSASFAGLGYITITIILILTAFATFLTGMIAKFRYHIICSFICWIIAAISFFMLNANIYLLLAAISIFVWIIPGFILNATFKKLQHGR
jgi:hypothetical protein